MRHLRTPSLILRTATGRCSRARALTIRDEGGRRVERTIVKSTASARLVDKGNHKHFMAKEIHEQPEVVGHTLAHYIDMVNERVALPGTLPFDWAKLKRLSISACGTAFYAGLVAKYWFERFAKLPVEIDIASEFRYRGAPLEAGDLAIFISQSGETADTLATLRYARENKQHILSVVNVPTSTHRKRKRRRDADARRTGNRRRIHQSLHLPAQHACLSARLPPVARVVICPRRTSRTWYARLIEVPRLMAAALTLEPQIEKLAQDLAKARDVLYLGRGTSFPIALEGALKLKEISYIHAEGYAAGELKHGPIALIDETMPVIVIAPHDRVFEKTVSNMQEVAARGGKIILVTDPQGAREATVNSLETLSLPEMASTVTPLGLRHSGAADCVSYRGSHRHGRRPAAQSREIGHGRIGFAHERDAKSRAMQWPRMLRKSPRRKPALPLAFATIS